MSDASAHRGPLPAPSAALGAAHAANVAGAVEDGPPGAWLQAVLDALPVPLVVAERDSGRILASNRAASALHGAPLVEGQSLAALMAAATPTDAAGHALLSRAVKGGAAAPETVVWHASRGPLTLQVHAVQLPDLEAHPSAVVLCFQDVTERHAAEQRLRRREVEYRSLADSMPQIVWTARPDGRVDSVNGAATLYTGLPAEALLGEVGGWPIHPDDAARTRARWAHSLTRGERHEDEHRLRGGDGHYRWFLVRATPMRGSGGMVEKWFGTTTDIDALRRGEEERERLLERERARVRQLRALAEAAVAITAAPGLEEVLRHVTERARGVLGAHLAVTALAGGEAGREARAVSASERWRRLQEPLVRGELWGVEERVLREGRPLRLSRAELEAAGAREPLPRRGLLAAPLLGHDGACLGVIQLADRSEGDFGDEDEVVLVQLAQMASVAVENARLYAQSQASAQRFQCLVEATTQVVWTLGGRGEVREDSPSWRAFTGQTREEYLQGGQLAAIHPEDRGRVQATWRRALEACAPYACEYRLRRPDGSWSHTVSRGTPLRAPDGSVREWVGTNTDVSAERRALKAVEFLAEASAALASSLDVSVTLDHITRMAVQSLADWCCVYLWDGSGVVALAAVSHAEPTGEALLRELHRRFPPDPGARVGIGRVLRSGRSLVVERVTGEALRAMARGEEHLALLRQLEVRSHLTVPLLVQCRVVGAITLGSSSSRRQYGPEDVVLAEELARRVATAVDHAQLFTRLQAEHRRAEEANRAKDEFLATVSHELRTPLTSMLGWTQMLRAGRLTEEKRQRALETIERNARAQMQLIEDLLDVSRIISGKLRLACRPLELDRVVEAALEAVRPSAEARGIVLEAQLPATPLPLVGDPDRLQQVAWNLLSNSLKFTPRSGRVRVQLERQDGQLVLTVVDTGQGIHPDFLPYLFERFRQADASTTRTHGGLGLGLAIVRHLVELHGGTVEAQSEGEGRGATFRVRLPERASLPAPEATAAPVPVRPRVAVALPARLEGLHVLVVDDEADTRELLTTVLEGCRARVSPAASAAEGLARLEAGGVDLLVSDVSMPGVDGYEFIRRVRALPPEQGGQIPAVALTAYARGADRTRSLLAGFQMHVPKPVEPAELVVVLASLAGRSVPG